MVTEHVLLAGYSHQLSEIGFVRVFLLWDIVTNDSSGSSGNSDSSDSSDSTVTSVQYCYQCDQCRVLLPVCNAVTSVTSVQYCYKC